jgi:hypothetical protein
VFAVPGRRVSTKGTDGFFSGGGADVQPIFEMSSNRVEFVSRLFSRYKPSGLAANASAERIFKAFEPRIISSR